MPIKYFTDSLLERLNNFPDEIQHKDLITFFTLSESDKAQIPVFSSSHNRLGFALQLCTLRFMGFVVEELTRTPSVVVEYLAHQLNIDPSVLSEYGTRAQTRSDYLVSIMETITNRGLRSNLNVFFCRFHVRIPSTKTIPPVIVENLCSDLK